MKNNKKVALCGIVAGLVFGVVGTSAHAIDLDTTPGAKVIATKAYVDDKFQAKGNYQTTDNLKTAITGDGSATEYPSTSAVKTFVDSSIDTALGTAEGETPVYELASNKKSTITTGDNGNYQSSTDFPTIGAVTAYVSTQLENAGLNPGEGGNGLAQRVETLEGYVDGQSVASRITTALANNQPDWNETTTTSAKYIKNKPTIPNLMDGQSDWNETTTTSAKYIKNKPTIPVVDTAITSGSGNAVQSGAVYTAINDLTGSVNNVSQYVSTAVPPVPDGCKDAGTYCVLSVYPDSTAESGVKYEWSHVALPAAE